MKNPKLYRSLVAALVLGFALPSAAGYEFRVPLASVGTAMPCASPGSIADTTPGTETVAIPVGCPVTATIFGGNGGWGGDGSNSPGGLGSQLQIQVPANLTKSLTLTVGSGGASSGNSSTASTGGGAGGAYSGLEDASGWLAIAGGGGGGGGYAGAPGGGFTAATGGFASNCPDNGGIGGNQTEPGAGGICDPYEPGAPGSGMQGGSPSNSGVWAGEGGAPAGSAGVLGASMTIARLTVGAEAVAPIMRLPTSECSPICPAVIR